MSNYLHRLAASALRTSSAIRPLVGSLYSVSTVMSETPMEAVQQEAAPFSLRQLRAESHTISSASGREARLPFSALPVENSAAEERVEQASIDNVGTHPHFTPLLSDLPLRELRNRSGVWENPGREAASASEQTAAHLESAHSELPDSATKAFEVLHQRLLQPLISPDVRFNPPLQARSIPLTAANERAAAQSDQIEIHIGRIEVTAVPAPVTPAPAPQTRRKSLDLGEYLKRGDGRAS